MAIRTILDRRMLLKGLAASAGLAILSACGDEAAPAATATRASGTAAAASTTGAGAATTAATAAGGAASAAVGTATRAASVAAGASTTAAGASSAVAATGTTSAATTGGSAVAATATRPASAPAGTTAASPAAATTAATTAPTAAATTAASPAAATAAGTVTGATTGTAAAAVVPMLRMPNPMGPMPAMCQTGSIVSAGSTALQPLIQAAAMVYNMRCMGAMVQVQGGGSGTGLTQVNSGAVAIGASDIFAEEREGIDVRSLVSTRVCAQVFCMAANPSVNVTNLTQDQVIGIWTGRITNFREVGGADAMINIINRPASSGTRATFQRYALRGMREAQGRALTEDSTGAVAQAIRDTPGAIGYLVYSAFAQQPDLKIISFNGRQPTEANVSDDSYPIWSYGHMYTKGMPMGLAGGFLQYMLSPDVQMNIVQALGYFPIGNIRAMKTPPMA